MDLLKIQLKKVYLNKQFFFICIILCVFNLINFISLLNIYNDMEQQLTSYYIYYQHILMGQYLLYPLLFIFCSSFLAKEYKYNTVKILRTSAYSNFNIYVYGFLVPIALLSLIFLINEILFLVTMSIIIQKSFVFKGISIILLSVILLNILVSAIAYFIATVFKKQFFSILLSLFVLIFVKKGILKISGLLDINIFPNITDIFLNLYNFKNISFIFVLIIAIAINIYVGQYIFNKQEIM